ncbi:MAG: hypothetical protein ACXAC2_13155 [Candidatus Kariarchaeaceae archaeon]
MYEILHNATELGVNISSTVWNNADNIMVYDEDLNLANHTITVTVFAGAIPVWVHTPTNISFEESSTGNFLSWNATETFPRNYLLFRNGTLVGNSSWIDYDTVNPSLEISFDGLLHGTYNFTIYLFDSVNNSISHWVLVNVFDLTSPEFTSSPNPILYGENSNNNILFWDILENHPDNYVITHNSLLNDELPFVGSWLTNVSLNVDGLLLGVYNFTILVIDTHGNNNSHSVLVTVIDDYLPEITYLSPVIFSELNVSNEISWILQDNHPWNYTIYQDMIPIQSVNWTDGQSIVLNIVGLAIGMYNFTIEVWDESLNPNILVTLIEVLDLTNPEFTTVPSPPQYSEGATGITIQWNATDKYPGNFTIYKDDVPIRTGDWNNSEVVGIGIGGLLWGSYNYTIVVQDVHNNTATHSITITVTDDTDPIISGPSDDTFVFNSISGVLSWDVTDNYPATYTIFRNGSEIVPSNVWVSGLPISTGFTTDFIGVNNYTLVVLDQSGNKNVDTVFIFVTEINTLQPEIEIVHLVHEGDIDKISGFWQTSNSNPIMEANIEGQLMDGTNVLRTVTGQTNITGQFDIDLEYEEVSAGNYIWVFSFSKDGYNDQRITRGVTLTRHTPKIDIQLPSSEITVGSSYVVTIKVTYNNNASSILSLDKITSGRQGGVDKVLVTLVFEVKLENGTSEFLRSGITEEDGVTTVSLEISPDMIEISDVRVDSIVFPTDQSFDFDDNEDINNLNTEIAFNNSITITKSETKDGTSISSLLPFIYILFGLGLIAFLIIVVWYFRRKQKLNIERRNQEAYDEIYGLNSIRLIVMHSLANQNPFFSEQFGLFETDSVLIAGLTSALSAFLDEIEEEKLKGFQTMERSGVSITSHKGELSILTVISSLPLQKNFLERIKSAHKEIESQFGGPISEPTISVSSFDPNKIADIFEDCNLKFHLLRGVVLDVAKLSSILDISSRNDNALLTHLRFIPIGISEDLRINTLLSYFEFDRGLTSAEASRILIIAYEKKVLIPKTFLLSEDMIL